MVQVYSAPDMAHILRLDPASGSRQRRRQWLLLTLLLLALVVVARFWSMRGATSAPHYKTQDEQRSDLTVTVTATGYLEPTNQVEAVIEVCGTISGVEAY